MANQEKIEFAFLKDSPLSKKSGDLFDFYHSNIAPALKEILESDTCVHTIGLFSKWGTGKSTIIEIIQGDIKSPMFVFDAWKYQDDALHRIFLIKLVDFLIEQKLLEPKDKELLDPLYKSTEERYEAPVDQPSEPENWFKKIRRLINTKWPVSLALSLGAIWVCLAIVFKNGNVLTQALKDFVSFITSVAILAAVFKPMFEKIWEHSVDKFLSSLTPLASIKTRVEKEDQLNSPEQFEALFKQVLQKVNKKVVIVFDNIDRVQGDVAIKILATVKTFLDPIGTAGLVFVVPCDSGAIEEQVRDFYGKGAADFDSSEYLRKLFNLVIWTPEFINTDLQSFTESELKKTGKIANYINSEDVILVINAAFSNNPRQIKQFINNLIAAVITASKTDVWETIKLDIPYLAKILVLKEKFPAAYTLLKERWYDPQNIFKEDDTSGLKDFMRNTSRITVPDAEPFIYFKKPVVSTQLSKSNEIRQSLIEGKKEEAATLIAAVTNKEAVADFVCDLLMKYKHQQEVLLKIFDTHLHVFHDAGIKSTKKGYYDCLATTIDSSLWQSYLVLPTKLIFDDVLKSSKLDTSLKKQILDRYVLALKDDVVKQKPDIAKDIISSFIEHRDLLTSENKTNIASAIEQDYVTNIEVIALFQDVETQKVFINKEAFTKFINSVEQKNITGCLQVLLQLREYITANNGFSNIVIQRLVDLLQHEFAASPDMRSEKQQLMRAITTLLKTFEDGLSSLTNEQQRQLILELIQTINGIGSPENRWICIESLQIVRPIATEEEKNKITTHIASHFSSGSLANIKKVFDEMEADDTEILFDENLHHLLPRAVNDPGLLEYVYDLADDSQKVIILKYLIDHQSDHGIAHLISMGEEIPDRVEIIKHTLSKVQPRPAQERVAVYSFLPTKINKNDPEEIKSLVVTQIKELLKSDSEDSSKVGYEFFIQSGFLGNEKCRDIAGEVLAFLREPGKTLTSVHRYSLKSISSCYDKLHDTVKNDFAHTLFDNLRPGKDRSSLEVMLGVLEEIQPSYLAHKTDFDDLLDRLKTWPEAEEDKRLIIEAISKFKSTALKKEEKNYWKAIGELNLTPKEGEV